MCLYCVHPGVSVNASLEHAVSVNASLLCAAGSEWKHCPAIRDESDNCDVFYSYHYNPDIKTVQVQKTKRTYKLPLGRRG